MVKTKIVIMPDGSDIFLSKCDTLVNPVNCVGIMSKGLALEFKRRYPEMFAAYKRECGTKRLGIGQPFRFRMPTIPHIVCFPTKRHWRDESRLLDIERGMKSLVYLTPMWWNIKSMAIPALGCGEGGLLWKDVLPVILSAIEHANDRGEGLKLVELYPPRGEVTCQQ